MNIKQIQELIKILNRSNIGEIRIEEKDFKITLKAKDYLPPIRAEVVTPYTVPVKPEQMPYHQAEQLPAPPAEPASQQKAQGEDARYVAVKSPMIGTFYRSPSPDKEPFIKVGDRINKGDTVCIIEAMKLFNEIESEVSGTVIKVLVENATPVEYDQPLFLVDPS